MDRPVHLLSPTSASLPYKSSHNLLNYARAHNGLWRLYGYTILQKANFSLQQKEYILFNYHGGWNIEKVPPTQSQLKSNYQPNKLILEWWDQINNSSTRYSRCP